MSYTPNNNIDFENAIQYYFGDSQTLPGGTNATEKYIGRFIPDQEISFTMQPNAIRAIAGVAIINNTILTTSQMTNDEYILYPPFYDSNNTLITSYLGIDMSGNGLYLDLNKPFKILINDPFSDTFSARATPNGETGNTYNATFVQNAYINLFSKPKPLISNWDTTNVTSLENAFKDRITFNEPLNNWNTTNVTNLRGTFQNARAFNQPIGSWDTSKVVNMAHMFRGCIAFNQDITNWNVLKVVDMTSMFQGATIFNQIIRLWAVDRNIVLTNMFLGAIAMLNEYLGTQYFGATPSYRYFGYTFNYVPSKDCGDEGIQGSSGRCKPKPDYKQLDTGGNDPKFNPAYAYALYIRGSLGRPGYQKFNIGNQMLNSFGSYDGAPGSGVRAPPRNTF